ncbi:MAG TPA: nuclear transport factor 2 family protein [Lysobacter sp.]
MDAFTRSDHPAVLACLTEDVEWVMPGAFHLTGKSAFDKEIENDAFTGSPAITVTRMTEAGGVVVAEGTVLRTQGGRIPQCRLLRCFRDAGRENPAADFLSDGVGE